MRPGRMNVFQGAEKGAQGRKKGAERENPYRMDHPGGSRGALYIMDLALSADESSIDSSIRRDLSGADPSES